MSQIQMVGVVSAAVIEALGEGEHRFRAGDEIYIGDSNIEHMKRRHPSVYLKYQDKLPQILTMPDYVGINKDDGSLEYVKMFSEHVKLAVRVAGDEKLYVRTMYTILKSRTEYFMKSGRLKPLTKQKK